MAAAVLSRRLRGERGRLAQVVGGPDLSHQLRHPARPHDRPSGVAQMARSSARYDEEQGLTFTPHTVSPRVIDDLRGPATRWRLSRQGDRVGEGHGGMSI